MSRRQSRFSSGIIMCKIVKSTILEVQSVLQRRCDSALQNQTKKYWMKFGTENLQLSGRPYDDNDDRTTSLSKSSNATSWRKSFGVDDERTRWIKAEYFALFIKSFLIEIRDDDVGDVGYSANALTSTNTLYYSLTVVYSTTIYYCKWNHRHTMRSLCALFSTDRWWRHVR